MTKKLIVILLFIFSFALAWAQQTEIHVEAQNQALNHILVELRKQYDFQFSYSDNQLSKYKLSISKTFHSKDEAINFLLKNLPLKLKKTGEVYIIIPYKKKETKEEKEKFQTRITGQIVEAGSYEPLPFSHILINNHQLVSDVMGSFNYIASADSTFHVRISHLGYYVYDSIFQKGISQQFTLTPSSEYLPEITVKNNIIEKASLIGERSGKIKLNHNISRFLPGQGDNSVFNLLRLMPGIQAAGEQSTDLLIWGSYEGQSQITFDEFTVFGLKNYNDNISVVNPFLVKNIEIYKGGYEAKYGNRVGGIVNISGKNGNRQKPTFSFNINPTTVNSLLEIPLFKTSTFMVAYRQTYYNLYNIDDFNIFAPTRPMINSVQGNSSKTIDFDINVYPNDYQFKDLNLKFTSLLNNGDLFYVSIYGGGDYFKLSAETELARQGKGKAFNGRIIPFSIKIANTENNNQRGLTTYYGKNWANGSSTKFILTHSNFSKVLADSIESENLEKNNTFIRDRESTSNNALENEFKIQHAIPLNKGRMLEFGGGLIANQASINRKINLGEKTLIDTFTVYKNNRAYLYLQDNFNIGSRLSIKTGFRMNYAREVNHYFFEPRLSASYKLNENTKLNASWGLFNQYMYKIADINKDKNYTYLWITANNNIPTLRATHWISGLNYFKNNFTINIEAYYKTTNGIIQRVYEIQERNNNKVTGSFLYAGKAKTYGIDTYVKKDFGRHSIWASYTLSKTLESLAPITQPIGEYTLAPHDQRHEFKLATLFNVNKFYLSGNYVYGSGMKILSDVFRDEEDVSYNRFDVALTYKFNFKKINGETGLSILNLLDTQNLKYANLKNIVISSDLEPIKIYSEAVPFTPILFLKMIF